MIAIPNTLVFTEPVSGVQYTCVGWKYYYDQRAYVLELADNSMSYDGTDIKYLVLKYGDDALTIGGYSTETTPDNLDSVFLDSYSYVMVSQSECALNGHTYTYETTSEPTCSAAGERKYTCSVCGDEYAEEIPKTEHSYEYSVHQAATCLNTGIGLYTCSGCGDQYTELIPASGHTLELVEYVPTEYDGEGRITSAGYTRYRCSVCHTEQIVNDDVGVDPTSFWERIQKGVVNTLANLIEAVLDVITTVLSSLLSLVTELLSFCFGFLTSTVVSGISGFFSSFSDGSLLEFFRQEQEDGSQALGLPDGVAAVFAFFAGVIVLIPWPLRALLIFGAAALILLAVMKLLNT